MYQLSRVFTRAHSWTVVGLAAALAIGLLDAQPALAQQNPLPDKAASVVIGAPDFVTDSNGDGLAEVYGSYDAAIDPVTKKVFVADNGNYRVLRFANYRSLQNGDPAEHVFGGDCNDNGDPSPTCIWPWAIEIDDAGRLWVSDDFGRLLRYDDAAESSDRAFSGELDWTTSNVNIWDIVVTGADRDILIAHDIGNYEFMYWDISGSPADGALPYQTQAASLYLQSAGGHYSSLAHDYKTGGLWTLDTYWSCVRYYPDPEDLSAPQGVIGAIEAHCPRELNQTGLSATEMSALAGVWASADGTLFVGDYDNYRLMVFRDAAARSIEALAAGEFVSADDVYGADDFESYGYDDPSSEGVDPAKWIGYLNHFSGDPTNNTLIIPMEYPSSARLFITPEDTSDAEPTPVAVCDLLPDMAITPERVELSSDGSASLTVTMRNLCNDRPFQTADLLVSLSDGLSVAGGSAGMLNLGQRAAWQQIALAPGETRSWTLTSQAAAVLPTPPLHVVELYYLGGAAKRIDGVFVPAAAVPAPVVEAPAAPAVEPATTTPPALPVTLPNTGTTDTALPVLIAALALTALLFGRGLLHR